MGLLPRRVWLAPGAAGSGATNRPPRPIRRRSAAFRTGVPGPGGGSTAFVPVPLAWRSTTRQVCGLYPWGSPGQLPLVGAPIGRHQLSGAVICFDHVSWFLANLLGNPSVLIIARPGLGKSTLSSKLMLWLNASGYVLLIPGDTKPDYVELTRSLGGEVRAVARSGGAALNPCDPGGMAAAAARIGGAAGAALLAEAIGRAVVCLSTLVELGQRAAAALRPGRSRLRAAGRRPRRAAGPAPGRGPGGGARPRRGRRLRRADRPAAALAAGVDRRPVRRRVHPPSAAARRPAAGGESRHVEDQGRGSPVPGRGDDRRLVGDVRAGRGRPGAGGRGAGAAAAVLPDPGRAVAGAAPGRVHAGPGERADPAQPHPGRRPDYGHALHPGPGSGPGLGGRGHRGARRRHRHRRGAQARAGRAGRRADADRRRALGDRDLVVDERVQ